MLLGGAPKRLGVWLEPTAKSFPEFMESVCEGSSLYSVLPMVARREFWDSRWIWKEGCGSSGRGLEGFRVLGAPLFCLGLVAWQMAK